MYRLLQHRGDHTDETSELDLPTPRDGDNVETTEWVDNDLGLPYPLLLVT